MLATFLILSASVALIHGAAWEAVPRDDANWMKKHEGFVNNTRNQRDDINILFYGDSITEMFPIFARAVWNREYVPLGTANYGISGDRVEHLLWRVTNDEVEGLHPKVIVLKIGTNNWGESSNNILIGIYALVTEMRNRMPDAKILLLGILPRNDDEQMFEWLQDINIKLSNFEDGEHIFFQNMFNQFSVGWPFVDPELFLFDKLHLSQAGYAKWADTMRALFDRLRA